MIINEIKNIDSSRKELKKFGLSVGIAFLLLALILFYFDKSSSPYFGSIGLFLILFGLILPVLLLPLQKIWMGFAVVMGFISSRVILTIVFFLVLTPIGLLAKIFRKKFLTLSFDSNANTYWEKKDKDENLAIKSEKQF